jgi:hypothetical protein
VHLLTPLFPMRLTAIVPRSYAPVGLNASGGAISKGTRWRWQPPAKPWILRDFAWKANA